MEDGGVLASYDNRKYQTGEKTLIHEFLSGADGMRNGQAVLGFTECNLY